MYPQRAPEISKTKGTQHIEREKRPPRSSEHVPALVHMQVVNWLESLTVANL